MVLIENDKANASHKINSVTWIRKINKEFNDLFELKKIKCVFKYGWFVVKNSCFEIILGDIDISCSIERFILQPVWGNV